MKKIIALIGAGQLGSRHLQGLKKSQNELLIYVIDSNVESLRLAQERYNQIEDNEYSKSVAFAQDLNSLPNHIDMAIIATGSMPRAEITKKLLSQTVVDYIIFEKVLFPRISEYYEIGELLKIKGVKAWVNCPRRMWKSYQDLSTILTSPIKMSIVAKNWGLCCNSIHFIDIFMLLVKDNIYDISLRDIKLIECKRPGYIEMVGEVHVETPNGSHLTLVSTEDETIEKIVINSDNHQIVVVEAQGVLNIDGIEQKIEIPYQSGLTNYEVDEIFAFGNSHLSSFHQSVNYHLPFVDAILNEYNKLTGCKGNLCPIT